MTTRPPALPTNRLAALAVIAGGALLMVGAVFADSIGLSGGGDGFGWKQLIAAIVGLMILLIGVAWFLRPLFAEEPDDSVE